MLNRRGFSEAILDFKGDIKNNVIDVYLPGIDKPVFSEVCFNLPSYGVTLGLRVIERKVYDIGSGGRRFDCHWIRVNATLRASRDVFRVLFRIGHGGGWVNKPWLILRRGGYASDHWIKWTPSEKLIVDFDAEGFRNRFILNFNSTPNRGNDFLSRVLSEDELKSILEQPPYEKLNLSKAPKSLNIRLAGEKVTNETVWVTGAAISCVLYITLFIMVNRIKFERVGQRLTAGQVLRMIEACLGERSEQGEFKQDT
ncbi:MAG: hypothetical protein QW797_01865 [Thermoproteota archaeon]